MNCWHCNTKLIWGGDHDIDDHEDYEMVTNLSCPNCGSYVEVYLPRKKKQPDNVIFLKPKQPF
tara:strand:- start:507 stop:695 length:189 start_codon:yes stop_codon:yes gene_type:complete